MIGLQKNEFVSPSAVDKWPYVEVGGNNECHRVVRHQRRGAAHSFSHGNDRTASLEHGNLQHLVSIEQQGNNKPCPWVCRRIQRPGRDDLSDGPIRTTTPPCPGGTN